MGEVKSSLAANVSIMNGGLLQWFPVRLGYVRDNRRQVVRRALFVVLASWFPMLVLSLIQGQAYGTQIKIPFLWDMAVNVRFLIAVPILILAESEIDRRLRTHVLQFLKSGFVTEKELSSFEAVIEKTVRLRDRILPKVLLIAAALLPSVIVKTELLMSGLSNWHYTAAGLGK
jgi:hypothetical protein